jgi:2-phosphosulfolactate phosphatase
LRACGSAVELIGRGFTEDVELCLEEDVSRMACRLMEDHFVPESQA